MTRAFLLHRFDGAPLSTEFRQAAFGAGDPFASHREIAWQGPDSLAVGRVDFVGAVSTEGYPHIETLVVVEGKLTLTENGAAPLVLGPRQGAVIGCGTSLDIEASAGTRFVFCAASCERPTQRGVFPLRADANFKPSATLPAEVLLGPAPECRSDNVFLDDGAQFSSGTWDSTPYHRIVRSHRANEFMYIVAGDVRFATSDGSVITAANGDAIFVPKGVSVGWESSERVSKFYVVQTVQA
jgi:uncharacterized cupin superfamily protein